MRKTIRFFTDRPVLSLLLIVSLINLIIFRDYIFSGKLYLFKDIGCDSINMYLPWFNCLSDYLKSEGIPAWSFEQGMGQNIFPLWLGDVFSNVMMLFDKKYYPYAMAYIEMIKITLSAVFFFKFLKELKLGDFVAVLFALCYSFSGFMLVGGTWYIYSLEALYLAVVLLGIERWLNHQKFFWLVLGFTLICFLQPFLLYPWFWFLIAYIPARYSETAKGSFRDLFIFFFKSGLLILLAVGISACQFLPDLLQMVESPRVGGSSGLFDKLKSEPLFGMADEHLRFTTLFRSFGADMIGPATEYKGWMNYLEAPLFYCGVLCLILFPQFFTSLRTKHKLIYGTIAFLFFLPLIFPFFRYLIWGFSGNYFRSYSLMIVLWLIIFSARGFQQVLEQKKISYVLLLLPLVLFIYLLLKPNQNWSAAVNTVYRNTEIVLLVVYAVLLIVLARRFNSIWIKMLLLLICMAELTFLSWSPLSNRDALTVQEMNDGWGYNDFSRDAIDFLKKADRGFYRINKDDYNGGTMYGTINDAKAQGYYGTASYSSFNQKNYIRFLITMGYADPQNEFSTRWASGLIGHNYIFSLMSGKYWLIKHPESIDSTMIHEKIASFGDVEIHRNKAYAPLGFAYNKLIRENDFQKLSPPKKELTLLSACVAADDFKNEMGLTAFVMNDTSQNFSKDLLTEKFSARNKDPFVINSFSENNIKGNVRLSEDGILFLGIPFDEGWKVKVNGEDAKLQRFNLGFSGLPLKKGNYDVELSFQPRTGRTGAIISLISVLLFAVLLWSSNRKSLNK